LNRSLPSFGGGHQKVEAALLGLLREAHCFYGIGASIGWYALLGARSTKGPVIAFEPLLTHAALAVHTARINGLPATVVSAAVANTDGWEAFARRERKLDKLGTRHATVPVPVVTLDGWIAATGHPLPDVVRIDVEGAEAEVFAGMRKNHRQG
jgi:FkbM family methyltransferase